MATDVLVDTSALIDLAELFDLCCDSEWARSSPLRPSADVFRRFAGFDFAIEALVLYDNVYVDGQSFEDHIHRLYHLDPLSAELDFIAFLPLTRHQRNVIHQTAFDSQVAPVVRTRTFAADAKKILDHELAGIGMLKFREARRGMQYSDADDSTLLKALGEDVYSELRRGGLSATENVSAFLVAVQMLRALFYCEVQRQFHCHLVLHPFKGLFVDPPQSVASTILKVFDIEVRKHREERMTRWLGAGKPHFHVPLLVSYVFSRSMNGGLANAIRSVRDSPEATNFRRGISELVNAIEGDDTKLVDETLHDLEVAADSWTRGLGLDPRKHRKNVNVSVPMFGGLGTDIPVTLPKIRLSPSDRILTFIHTMLLDEPVADHSPAQATPS